MSRRVLRYLAYIGAFLLLACDGGITAPAPVASTPTAIKAPGLDRFERLPRPVTSCSQFDYDSTAADIGPEGGRIKIGPHRFLVPPGALDRRVWISMVIPGDGTASVRFQPEGLRFSGGALPTLRLNYAGCKPPKGVIPTVVYLDEALNVLEWMPSWRNGNSSRVSTRVAHFSRYAVAW